MSECPDSPTGKHESNRVRWGDDLCIWCIEAFGNAATGDALDRPHIPGTDYYDGRDGSIEAEDDDEDRIAAEDAAREEMHELVEWQRSLKGW